MYLSGGGPIQYTQTSVKKHEEDLVDNWDLFSVARERKRSNLVLRQKLVMKGKDSQELDDQGKK